VSVFGPHPVQNSYMTPPTRTIVTKPTVRPTIGP